MPDLREWQVPLVDLDKVEDARAVFNSGLGGHRIFIAPENARSMKFRLEEAVALRPPPGYTPAEAVQGFCNVNLSAALILLQWLPNCRPFMLGLEKRASCDSV